MFVLTVRLAAEDLGARQSTGYVESPRAKCVGMDDLLITRKNDSLASALYQRFLPHARPQRARDSP
jgi:hypothetical protein